MASGKTVEDFLQSLDDNGCDLGGRLPEGISIQSPLEELIRRGEGDVNHIEDGLWGKLKSFRDSAVAGMLKYSWHV